MRNTSKVSQFARWLQDSREAKIIGGLAVEYIQTSQMYKNAGMQPHHKDAAILLATWALHKLATGSVVDSEDTTNAK